MARTARQKGFGPYDVRLLSCHPGRVMPEQMFFFNTQTRTRYVCTVGDSFYNRERGRRDVNVVTKKFKRDQCDFAI